MATEHCSLAPMQGYEAKLREEAEPCPQVLWLLVRVGRTVLELGLQFLVVHGVVHVVGRLSRDVG